jgi:hypothetical protein
LCSIVNIYLRIRLGTACLPTGVVLRRKPANLSVNVRPSNALFEHNIWAPGNVVKKGQVMLNCRNMASKNVEVSGFLK